MIGIYHESPDNFYIVNYYIVNYYIVYNYFSNYYFDNNYVGNYYNLSKNYNGNGGYVPEDIDND